MDVKKSVTLISGGSSGIGLAMARLLAAREANVWLLARDSQRLAAAVVELETLRCSPGQKFGYFSADVTQVDQVIEVVEKVIEADGVPDLLVNSAGAAHPGAFQNLDLEVFHWMMDVNYYGTINLTKAVLPWMIRRGSGYLVNIASLAGFFGLYGYTAYSASKFAVRGFSDALRCELKPLNIRLSLVFPLDTDTPQLAYENQHKPAVTKEIAKIGGPPASAAAVALAILRGIRHERYVIIPGWQGNLLYRLAGWMGNGVYPIMDWLVSWAQAKDGRR